MKQGVADTNTTTTLESDDHSYVKFNKLLARAQAEGRVDGKHRCSTCGMRFRTEVEAHNCCAIVAESA
jgi:hypothetical protein